MVQYLYMCKLYSIYIYMFYNELVCFILYFNYKCEKVIIKHKYMIQRQTILKGILSDLIHLV